MIGIGTWHNESTISPISLSLRVCLCSTFCFRLNKSKMTNGIWVMDNIAIPYSDHVYTINDLQEPAEYYYSYCKYLMLSQTGAGSSTSVVIDFDQYLSEVCKEAVKRQVDTNRTWDDFYRRWNDHFGFHGRAKCMRLNPKQLEMAQNIDINNLLGRTGDGFMGAAEAAERKGS